MNEAPLNELLSTVVDNRGRTCPVVERGFPLIATNCVKSDHLYPVFEKIRFVDDKTFKNWFRGHPKPGDFIFVLKGSPGEVCLTPEPVPFCIAQDMVALRANPGKVYPGYLFSYLRSTAARNAILNMHVGTMIPHFKKGDFDKLIVPLPDENSQRFIGDFYLTLSKKIELNRRMNETLEALAQAIFKDWFVDFAPPRRKQAGETNPVAILGGLIPDPEKAAPIAALFPDNFGDDCLPEGWEKAPFARQVQIVGGGTPKTSMAEYWGGDIPWFSVTDTPTGSDTFVFETGKTLTIEGLNSSSARLIAEGTTIISARGTVGNLALAGRELTFNQSCYALQASSGAAPYFIFLSTQRIVLRLQTMAHGSVFSTITRQTFESVEAVIPSLAVRTIFEQLVAPFFERIKASVVENRALAETRDYLLPSLMSGKVRVRDAEELLE